MSDLSPVQKAAIELHKIGLTVFPVKYNTNFAFPHNKLWYTRLDSEQMPEVFAGLCNLGVMVGTNRPRYLFVVECSTDQALDQQIQMVRAKNIAIWAVKAQVGGQLWFLSEYRRNFNSKPSFDPDLRIIGNTGFVIAPPSRVDDFQLRWLYREGEAPPIVKRWYLPWLRIKREHSKPIDHSYESIYIRQTINAAIMEDWTDEKLSEALTRSAINAGVSKLYPNDNTDKERSFTPLNCVQAYFDQAVQQSTTYWYGREGITDFCIVSALLFIFNMHSPYQYEFPASIRQIALYAHRDKDAVWRSIQRLIEKGILEHATHKTGHIKKQVRSKSYFYRFTKQVYQIGRKYLQKWDQPKGSSMGTLSNYHRNLKYIWDHHELDIAHRDALGLDGLMIYAASKDPGMTIEKVVRQTGFSISHVKKKHKAFKQFGWLIGQSEYQDLSDELIEETIEQTGVAGKRAERIEAFEADRQAEATEIILMYRQRHDTVNLNTITT